MQLPGVRLWRRCCTPLFPNSVTGRSCHRFVMKSRGNLRLRCVCQRPCLGDRNHGNRTGYLPIGAGGAVYGSGREVTAFSGWILCGWFPFLFLFVTSPSSWSSSVTLYFCAETRSFSPADQACIASISEIPCASFDEGVCRVSQTRE